jgi:hypothetical protein
MMLVSPGTTDADVACYCRVFTDFVADLTG